MKKVFFIAGIALLTLASCSKDWTCKCTVSAPLSGTTSSTITGTKNEAKTACDAKDSSTSGFTQDCEIQ